MAEARLVGTGEKVFSIASPQLWNPLPGDLCLPPTLDGFRKRFIGGLLIVEGLWSYRLNFILYLIVGKTCNDL